MATTTERGYGYEHRKLRAAWAPEVKSGRVTCTRYGRPGYDDCPGYIQPGEPWDLGHHDDDRAIYTGPEHQRCNRRAGQAKGVAARRRAPIHTRDW